jgi:hypothetical protein
VVLSLVRERWGCRAVVVDATGVGSGLAAFLGAALGPRVVKPYVYTAATKSKLGYDFLAAVNARRIRMYAASSESRVSSSDPSASSGQRFLGSAQGSPNTLLYELMGQASEARYELRAGQVMRWGVPESRGHDDLLNALVLCVQAGPVAARRVASGRAPGQGAYDLVKLPAGGAEMRAPWLFGN